MSNMNTLNTDELNPEINKKKSSKKIQKTLKNVLFQKDSNNEQNNESRNTDSLPSIMKKKEINKTEMNKKNKFLTENNEYQINKGLKENNSIQIIDEREKNAIEPVKKRLSYKIIFIYQNKDYYIDIKSNYKISQLKEIIAKEINLDKDKIILIYKDKEIDDFNKNVPINKFIIFKKLKSRPIIYVKKKYLNKNNLNSNDLSKFNSLSNLENKIKIINYPTMSNSSLTSDEDLFNIVSDFCKNNSISSAFQIEKSQDKQDSVYHIISFPSSDIVFDFNRYFNSLKLSNPLFKETKSIMILSKRKKSNNDSLNTINTSVENNRYKSNFELYEQRKNIGEKKRNQMNMNINMYINNSGPYTTSYELLKLDEKENKKKWLNPKGFISSVNKLSGVKI